MSHLQRWQYKTLFVFADAERVREQLNPFAVEELPEICAASADAGTRRAGQRRLGIGPHAAGLRRLKC